MALSITRIAWNTRGKLRESIVDITFDSSYPTGGEAISPSSVGLGTIYGMQQIGGNAAAGAYLFHWDRTNKKIMAFYPTGGAAPASLGDPSTVVPSGATTVTSSAAQPNLTENAGRGAELAAATDASTLSIRCVFIGF